MSLPPLNPARFSVLDEAPASELAPLVAQAASEGEPEALKALTALLLDRSLRLLREGSRQEILDEALALSGGISGPAGEALQNRNRETFGAWAALDDLLAEAARRSDRAAVPSLLKSTEGHGLAILELLAAEGRAIPRAEIRRRLQLAEAHLSHLLRDLEEADLIVRYRTQGSREVQVDLGRVGKEVVARSVLPPWLERLESAISEARDGTLDCEALTRELEKAGAPSRLAAERLVKLAEQFVPAAAFRGRSEFSEAEQANILRFKKEVASLPDSQFEAIQTADEILSVRALFGHTG